LNDFANMHDGSDGGWAAAKAKITAEIDRSIGEYEIRLARVFADPALSKQSREFLRWLWNDVELDRPLSMANKHVRRALTLAMVDTLAWGASRFPARRTGPGRFRMLSTSPDLGITNIAVRDIDSAAVSRHYYQAMRKADLHGIGLVDVALLHEPGEIEPSWLSIHYHGAVWSKNPEFKPRRAEKLAAPANRGRNKLDGRVARCTARKSPLTESNICGLGRYSTKISCGTKVWTGKEYRTMLAFWHGPQMLRMLEAYSHVEPLAALRGVGEGCLARRQVKRRLARQLGGELPYGLRLDTGWLREQWQQVYDDLSIEYLALQPA
jgi:hypothetical protein